MIYDAKNTRRFVFVIVLSSLAASAFSQTTWFKYEGNPVLDVGPPGSWDAVWVIPSQVIVENGLHKMWYSGFDGSTYRTGYATSTDGGFTWKKHLAPVFNPSVHWERNAAWLPDVIRSDSRYRMWYGGAGSVIGYAWSADGVVWAKYVEKPVLEPGPSSAWDAGFISIPSIVGPDSRGQYKMWYNGLDKESNRMYIGYATAKDSITWTKHVNNPVFSPDTPGSWDDRRIQHPRVLYNEDLYEMWYAGMRSDIITDARIGQATSPDGIHWTRSSANPVIEPGPPTSWDAGLGNSGQCSS